MMATGEELREMDLEQLSSRLKDARRELYELRFKLAVGQLENNRQVYRVRKDIARIMTVVHERRLEAVAPEPAPEAPIAVAQAATPESVEEAPAPVASEEAAKPARSRPRRKAAAAEEKEEETDG